MTVRQRMSICCHSFILPLLLMRNPRCVDSFGLLNNLNQNENRLTQQQGRQQTPITSAYPPVLLKLSSSNSYQDYGDDNDEDQQSQSSSTPLCDLQTFLRLADCVDTGGQAKVLIQAGECNLNGVMETRRAKKLFEGDIVSFQGVEYNVVDIVQERGYVHKVKPKKIQKMVTTGVSVDESGNRRNVVSRYRSKEWRDERKQRKGTVDGYVGNDDWKEIQKVKKMKERQMKRNDQTIQLKKYFASMANSMDDDDDGDKLDRKKQRLAKKPRFAKLEAMKKEQSRE